MSDFKIESPKSKFTSILLSGLILLSLPFLLILVVFVKLWRKLVVVLAKMFKPSLGEMLSTLGTLMTFDDLYGRPRCNVLLDICADGELTAEQYQLAFLEFEERASKDDLVYPELKQGLTSWMGYWFFQNDADFDVKNHIKEYSHPGKERYTEEDVIEMKEELMQGSWTKGRPMWEIFVINNYFPTTANSTPHTATIARFHHTLGDGVSLLIWLKKFLNMKELKLIVPIPTWPKMTLYEKLVLSLKFPFQFALTVADYLLAKYPESRFIVRRNDKQPGGKSSAAAPCYISQTKGIPMENIKRIKEQFGVSCSSVILAGISGFLHSLMVTRQDDDGGTLEKTVLANLPFPIPRTTERLRNQM
jgi:hypothetical protein